MKLTDGIYLVGSGLTGFSLTDRFDCHVYVIDCGQETYAMIDSGAGRDVPALLAIMQDDGVDPAQYSTILLTHQHADHAGGAAALCEAMGSAPRVFASPHAADLVARGDEMALSLPAARSAGIYPADYRIPCLPHRGHTDGRCPVEARRDSFHGHRHTRALQGTHLKIARRAGRQTHSFLGATPSSQVARSSCKIFQTARFGTTARPLTDWPRSPSTCSYPDV